MKKVIAFTLCILLCLGLAPVSLADGGGGDQEAFKTAFDPEGTGNYVVNADFTIKSEETVSLDGGTLIINEDKTITIEAGGKLELRGTITTNGGIIVTSEATIQAEGENPSNEGQLVIQNKEDTRGKFVNIGKLDINGEVQVEKADLNNYGEITIKESGDYRPGSLRLEKETELYNDESASIIGKGNGRIEVHEVSAINGLNLYQKTTSSDPMNLEDFGERYVEFTYVDNRWVHEREGNNHNDGPGHEQEEPEEANITITVTGNGIVSTSSGSITVSSTSPESITIMNNEFLTIKPEQGYRILKILITQDGISDEQPWRLEYESNGTYNMDLSGLKGEVGLEVVFSPIDTTAVNEMLKQNYAVLASEADSGASLKTSLANQFAINGYMINTASIAIEDFGVPNIVNGYDTFSYTVTVDGVASIPQTGYIVANNSDIIFKRSSEGNEYIYVAVNVPQGDPNSDDGVIEIPGWDSGTLDIFGYGNLIAMLMSSVEKVGEEGNEKIKLPFNIAQFHMDSPYFHHYGLYVMQENAYCFKVEADSDGSEQRAIPWELNRYTALTDGENISYVFFGNSKFTLALPPNGIGGIESFELEADESIGYKVTNNEDNTYTIEFLSNYYDDIFLNVTLTKKGGGDQVNRILNIRRVGVDIGVYALKKNDPNDPLDSQVAHGTQFGSKIDYRDGNDYQIYGTFYIPDSGEIAPKIYVTSTFKNGTVVTDIINVLDNPSPNYNAHDYRNGVFIYSENWEQDRMANACDYLLYSGSEANAPVEINVIVLEGNVESGEIFGGVTFGSGKGVTWKK